MSLICFSKVCQELSKGANVVLDITAGGWFYGRQMAEKFGLPYVHLQVSIYQWMFAADQLLQSGNATDAALVFSTDSCEFEFNLFIFSMYDKQIWNIHEYILFFIFSFIYHLK